MNLLGLSLAVGSAAGIGALLHTTFSPTSCFWGAVHPRGDSPGYALTFDDGPTHDSTTRALDILGELDVRATFFVIGVNARKCTDLLMRMRAEGHVVANHSLDHSHLGLFRGARYWDRQIRETDDIIENAIGVRPAMFRPPMGIKTLFVMDSAARQGLAVVTWSLRAKDGIATTRAAIHKRVIPNTKAGDIVVLHEGVEPNSRRDPSVTLGALKPLILQLRGRGLEPVQLNDLLGLAPYRRATSEAAAV